MGIPKKDGRMEGWLYIIRSSRIGLQFSRKRYFVLDDNYLKCYKTTPISQNEVPVRGSKIDCCIHVTDEGRESINRKVFFIFTLYSTLNHNDKLKFGASSPEDAAKWICSLKNAVLKECSIPVKDFVTFSKNKWAPLRLTIPTRSNRKGSIDFSSSLRAEAMTSDVIAPSPWKIFGCQNGLRLFKEAKDLDSRGRHWEEDPAIMAVGVVDGTSEAIYRTLMSLGPSRAEWDFCFYRGSVVEHLDGHTDIVHKQLYSDWLPRGMKRRDLLMRRYWRREDDGTYVILYHSVIHKKRPPGRGYIRACLKSGGYVVTPVNQGRQSLVKHMLAVDWKCWKSYLRPSSARSITIRMLGRVAALRELFRANAENDSSSELSSRDLPIDFLSTSIAKEDTKSLKKIEENSSSTENETEKSNSGPANLMDLTDASDEFFDVPDSSEPLGFESMDVGWSTDVSEELHASNIVQPRLSSAANFVKKLQEFTVVAQKKGYVDLQDMTREDVRSYCLGDTLQKDPSCTLPCSWSSADPSTFLIRGENYLKDHRKIKAKGTLMQMVGADWLRSDEREDDLCSRPNSIVQKYAEQGRPDFFFVVNIQVPGSTSYSLALYYMLKAPLEDTPLLHSFVNGDDAFRNSRFKLIPYISKGSWIVKQSVGKKAGLVGQALDVRYFRGKNHLENMSKSQLCVDVGSSTVARGVVNLVLGYLNNLVIEMAFLIQGNTEEELPEFLLGTCRLSHLDASRSVVV